MNIKDAKKEKNQEIDEDSINEISENFDDFQDFISDITIPQENIDKAIIQITERLSLDGEHLKKTLTELGEYEITKISILESINDTYIKSQLITGFISNLLIYRISKDRKGREDLKGLISSLNFSPFNEEMGGFDRLKLKLRGGR